MTADAPRVDTAIAQLTAPGAPFELVDVVVGGHTLKAYRHAPATVPALLDAARVHGAKPFIAWQGQHWSVERFFTAADALAGRMQAELGLRPGDRVAIAMRNRPEWAIAFVAAALVGAVPAPLNSFGLGAELHAALADVEPVLLFVDRERRERLDAAPAAAALRCRMVDVDTEAWPALVAPAGPRANAPALAADDPALLLFTSGSAARPKAVLSSQRAVCQAVFNIDFIGALSGLTSPKAVAALMARGLAPATLTVVPLFHVSGLHAQLLTNLRNGRRLVFLPRWDPRQALQTIRDECITQFNAAPAMVMQLLETPGFDPAGDARTLGGVGFGGAGLPQRLIEQVLGMFPDSMSGIGFGLTETNGVGSAVSGTLFAGRPNSSGVRSPIVELRIAGGDGQALPVGEVGEIWLRGVTVMQGYWRNAAASAQALVDGWLRTGDVGRVDEAGFLYVVDRLKDVINRSGEKIAAAEVESCLMQHPEVAEAAVIAQPDPVTGEAVVAIVVPRPGTAPDAQALRAHVAARLAAYKVPLRVHLRAEPMPRNAVGKLLRTELRSAYAS